MTTLLALVPFTLAVASLLPVETAPARRVETALAGDPQAAPTEDVAKTIKSQRASLAEYERSRARSKKADLRPVIDAVGALSTRAPAAEPKERTAIAKALEEIVRTLLESTSEADPATALVGAVETTAAASAIGKCGEQGVPILLDLLRDKAVEESRFALTGVHVGLGRAATKPAIEALFASARTKDFVRLTAVARGIAELGGAGAVVRKQAFDVLIEGEKSVREDLARRKKKLSDHPLGSNLAPALEEAFAKLAHEPARDVDAWRAWWKENEKVDWKNAR